MFARRPQPQIRRARRGRSQADGDALQELSPKADAHRYAGDPRRDGAQPARRRRRPPAWGASCSCRPWTPH